jgi:predicted Zn finger-like uncharacterized protein
MHIVCPHCTTSYAIDLATLGAGGRTVRCNRCKEVWLARPEDAVEVKAPAPAMAQAGDQAGSADTAEPWTAPARRHDDPQETPVVDSPSISADMPSDGDGASQAGADWPAIAQDEIHDIKPERPRRPSRLRSLLRRPAFLRLPGKPAVSLSTVCAAMGALVLALLIWRAEMVRLMPQTAAFYKMVGLDVNLRGLVFKDVKVTTETVEGKPVLVIEGVIIGEARQPVELPRLRFSVRDAQGAEIYAWNTVLEQPVLKPGEKAWFKSRLASPPPQARNIDVRFFSRRDVTAGNI